MRKLILAGIVALATCSPALSATILGYTSVSGSSLAPTTQGAGVTGTGVVRGPGLLAGTGSTFNSRNWTIGGTATTAAAAGDYVLFSMTTSTPYDLLSLEFGYGRSATGPQSISVDLIVNSITYSNFFVNNSVLTTNNLTTLDLSGFGGVTSLTMRVVGYAASSLAGTFNFRNILADGEAIRLFGTPTVTVAEVPLPASLPLLALALWAIPRRRKSKTA